MERVQVIARPHRILLALLAFSLAVGLGVATLLLRLGLRGVCALPPALGAAMPPLIIGSGTLLVLVGWPRR